VTDEADPDGKPQDIVPGSNPADPDQEAISDAAFNLWLTRGLHAMFDSIAEEPIPPELLAMIERNRKAS
jgi:hypothetical protein